MKKTFTISLLIILSIISGCRKEKIRGKTVAETITNGIWKVSFYKINSIVHTTDFSGYTFTFSTDSSLILTNGATSVTGSWEYNSEQNLFTILLNTTTLLSEINKNWLLILMNDDEFIFSEESSGIDEELHFNKI